MHLHLKTAHSITRSLQTIRSQLVRYLEDMEICMISCLNVADTGDLLALSAAARSIQLALHTAEDLLQSHAPRIQVLAEEKVRILDTGERIGKIMRFLRADIDESQAEIDGGGLSRREKKVYEEQIAQDMSRIRELARVMGGLETESEGTLEEVGAEWALLVKEVTDFLDEGVSLLIARST